MDVRCQNVYGNINLASTILNKLKVKMTSIVYYDINLDGVPDNFEEDLFLVFPSLFVLPAYTKNWPYKRVNVSQTAGQFLTLLQMASDNKVNWPPIKINLQDYVEEKIYDGEKFVSFQNYLENKDSKCKK